MAVSLLAAEVLAVGAGQWVRGERGNGRTLFGWFSYSWQN
jgi:hypothetical protein